MRLPLTGGSYSTRSIIASAQRCINYYPEINPRANWVPITHYQRPGYLPYFSVGSGPIRGIYRASSHDAYVVSGSQFFRIPFGTTSPVYLGAITAGPTTPVSMVDNGFQLMLVDGSTNGWYTDLGTNDFALISDPTGSFTGADKVDYIDTYILWNQPDTVFFGSTESNQIMPFNPLFLAGKTDYNDNLMTLQVNRHEIVLFGELKSEIWYDAAAYPLPFAELPGTYIEHGTIAKYSVMSQDISTYFLARNKQGVGMVLRFRGYITDRISNHAVEYAIAEMNKTVGISDAIGMTYQFDGHVFYVLTFPAGDQTWVYDAAVDDPHLAWHQEAWTDLNGAMHRVRAMSQGLINDISCLGDWQNGTIYQHDMDTYVDTVNGIDYPLTCVRSMPHIGAARAHGAQQMVEVDGKRLQFSGVRADLECGMGPVGINNLPAQVTLRWSDDRGRTWGSGVLQSTGQPGEYLTQPQWLGLGIARDRIFEISHSIAGPAALNGVWIDAEVLGT